jgi:hypothetical protein
MTMQQESTPATVTIRRNGHDDIQDRPVKLWLDDAYLGELKYGNAVTCDIASGSHNLKAHNQLFSTDLAFEATPGDQLRIKCVNRLTRSGILMIAVLGVAMLRVSLDVEAA